MMTRNSEMVTITAMTECQEQQNLGVAALVVETDAQTAILASPETRDLMLPKERLFALPSVEQMQRDVANATCKLQKAYIPRKKRQSESTEGVGSAASKDLLDVFPVDGDSDENAIETEDTLNGFVDSDDASGLSCVAEAGSSDAADPRQRTREETVSEELLIDGKRYRHTYQRKVVFERQKTREVFILPTSPKISHNMPKSATMSDRLTSPNYSIYNDTIDESSHAVSGRSITDDVSADERGSCGGMRLDLSVHSQEGGFSPVVVLLPQQSGDSATAPGTPLFRGRRSSDVDTVTESRMSSVRNSPKLLTSPWTTHDPPDCQDNNYHEGDTKTVCKTPTTPLLFSHMYHFGRWDKSAAILDPRLPAGITQPGTDTADLIFCVSPAEWHQTDISYGDPGGSITGNMASANFGTTAKGRIVACLQRFTQRSVHTGRQLHRSTYVQHTKIARWRSSTKETGLRTGDPSNLSDLRQPQISTSAPAKSAPLEMLGGGLDEGAAVSLEGVWRQATGGQASEGTSANLVAMGGLLASSLQQTTLLDACSYDRLQLLQSICPAAAAATIILGHQIPDMRRGCRRPSSSTASAMGNRGTTTSPLFTVSADAWCSRSLMLMEPSDSSLIFNKTTAVAPESPTSQNAGSPGAMQVELDQSKVAKQDCFLRGGTLESLLVYSLKVSRENNKGSYESLVPDIFLKIYPTFTITAEVVNRLIQRYLAFAAVEPGGLGCIKHGGRGIPGSEVWDEALNALRFLLKVVTEAADGVFSSQLNLKIVRFARLLELDSKTALRQFSGIEVTPNTDQDDELSLLGEGSAENNLKKQSTDFEDHRFSVAQELCESANILLNLVPISLGGFKQETREEKFSHTVDQKLATLLNGTSKWNFCECHKKLEQLLYLNPYQIAQQITLMEESYFDAINLNELIMIKQLMKGNTPTLSRCVNHFNGISQWVKILTRMANQLGSPRCPSLSTGAPATTNGLGTKGPDDSGPSNAFLVCSLCGQVQPKPLKSPNLSPKHYGNNGTYSKANDSTKNALLSEFPAVSSSITNKNNVAQQTDLPAKTKPGYLCMPTGSPYLSLRNKRHNALLEAVLWKLCDIAEELKKMKNFSSFLAIILGLQNASIQRVSKKLKMKLAGFGAYMLPPAFTAYRRDLEAAEMPCIPYLGLVFQQLIHLESGNLLFLRNIREGGDEAQLAGVDEDNAPIGSDETSALKMVNFWRCWKHYLILSYFIKKKSDGSEEKKSYGFAKNEEIQQFLQSFADFSDLLQQPESSHGVRRRSLRNLCRPQRNKTLATELRHQSP